MPTLQMDSLLSTVKLTMQTAAIVLCLEAGEMKEEYKSIKKQMKPTVFMSPEETELLVSTASEAALVLYPHQDYGDVIYLILLE